jgi:hypothetical protein
MTPHKTIIITESSNGELANQLWNYVSIYAYCKERGYALENWSFFEYADAFEIARPAAFIPRMCRWCACIFAQQKRKWGFGRRLLRSLYRQYARSVVQRHKNTSLIVHDTGIPTGPQSPAKPYYLPPSTPSDHQLTDLERQDLEKTIYFSGWLFRNPVGIVRYHKEIKDYFTPRLSIRNQIGTFIEPLRARYKAPIGVHIRQSDYATWRGGAFFVSQERVRTILDEYIQRFHINLSQTCFVIASDGPHRSLRCY